MTGVSGVGKSTAVERLAGQGYRAVDLDAPEWSEWVDSSDGVGPSPLQPGKDWVWRVDRVGELLAENGHGVLFVKAARRTWACSGTASMASYCSVCRPR